MRAKISSAEIIHLCNKTVDTFEKNTNKKIHRVTTPAQYISLVKELNKISSRLPSTAELLKHGVYTLDPQSLNITENQFRNAITGETKEPQEYLIDSCYIYSYGVGRNGFLDKPTDEALVKIINQRKETEPALKKATNLKTFRLSTSLVLLLTLVCLILFVLLIKNNAQANLDRDTFLRNSNQWDTIKKDLNILRYKPSKAEIDSIAGLWLCYTGSPQARPTEKPRYHMVVSNLIDVKYKNGYFTFTRYGASFNHVGYMVFESPGVVSIHSHLWNEGNNIESPRHSIMQLGAGKKSFNAVSSSWNFDLNNNLLIAIREVYVKIGTGGKVKENYNTLAGEQGKVVDWYKPNAKSNDKPQAYPIKIRNLDHIPIAFQDLINEKSIILADPKEGVILTKPDN